MTKQDVIANSWIFLFAGHESTANTLHFAFLFLAIALDTQARLQGDVDASSALDLLMTGPMILKWAVST
jgi:cytochrome P450